VLAAVRSALWLATVLIEGGEDVVGGGWVARAQRPLDEVEGDVVERGCLLQLHGFDRILKGELAEAAAVALQVTDNGRRFNDADLQAVGLHFEGRLAIYSGRVADGLGCSTRRWWGCSLVRSQPIYSGMVYCSAIKACQRSSTSAGSVSGRTPSPLGAAPSPAFGGVHRPVLCTAVS